MWEHRGYTMWKRTPDDNYVVRDGRGNAAAICRLSDVWMASAWSDRPGEQTWQCHGSTADGAKCRLGEMIPESRVDMFTLVSQPLPAWRWVHNPPSLPEWLVKTSNGDTVSVSEQCDGWRAVIRTGEQHVSTPLSYRHACFARQALHNMVHQSTLGVSPELGTALATELPPTPPHWRRKGHGWVLAGGRDLNNHNPVVVRRGPLWLGWSAVMEGIEGTDHRHPNPESARQDLMKRVKFRSWHDFAHELDTAGPLPMVWDLPREDT